MSFSELLSSGPGTPPAGLTLRGLILSALAEAASTRRDGTASCSDCTTLGRLCPDHRQDLAVADAYETAYMRIAGIGSDGTMLTLTGGLTS